MVRDVQAPSVVRLDGGLQLRRGLNGATNQLFAGREIGSIPRSRFRQDGDTQQLGRLIG
jgi:hypothetical protein